MATPTRVAELINTVAADNTLRDRLTNAADDDARTKIISSLGFDDVTPADVRTNAQAFPAPGEVEEVDDAQLAEVAGGGDTITTLTTTTTVTASAVAAT